MSRNSRWLSSSVSIANCMFLIILFKWVRNFLSLSVPWGQMMKVSTYWNQQLDLFVASCIAFASKSSMKKLAMTGDREDPIATPSVCS